MTSLLACLTALWAFLKQAWPTLRNGLLVGAGAWAQQLKDEAETNGKLAEQYKQVLEVEKANAARPVAGSATRLRESGYTRKSS